jgi:hypothetical protein
VGKTTTSTSWLLEELGRAGTVENETREEFECAVRKPAEKIQLEFDLPLLEFVLKELWFGTSAVVVFF